MKTRTPWLLLLALVAALATVAVGCGGGGEEAEEPAVEEPAAETEAGAETQAPADGEAAAVDCSATFGIQGPFTGDAASIGQEQLNWAQFAVQRFNEERGTSFELVEGDDQLDPAQGSNVAQQFVSNDAIVGVVGPAGSQVVEAAGPIYGRVNMPFVSSSATRTDLTDGRFPTFFRVVPNDSDQAPTDANYIAQELGAEKVMVVDDQTSYGRPLADGVAEILTEEGIEVVRESVSQDQTDFSALVSRVDEETGVVFLAWQIAANGQVFGQQLQEQGREAVIFGTDGLFAPTDFTIAGSYVSSFAPDIRNIDDPEVQDLVQGYNEQFGEEWGTFGPPTYLAAEVLMTAAAQLCEQGEEVTREALAEEVANVEIEDSILGRPLTFTESGDPEGAEFFIFQVNDEGEYELVQ